MNSKKKNSTHVDLYGGITEFKRGYQPGSNLVKDGNGDLLPDSHSILSRWKSYISPLLNIHWVNIIFKHPVALL
jgi:hypothetical protein